MRLEVMLHHNIFILDPPFWNFESPGSSCCPLVRQTYYSILGDRAQIRPPPPKIKQHMKIPCEI